MREYIPPIGSGHMNSSVAFSPTKGNLTSVNKVEALTISILQTPSRHIRIRMPTFEIYLRTKIKPNQVQIKNMRFLFPAQESQKRFTKCCFLTEVPIIYCLVQKSILQTFLESCSLVFLLYIDIKS